MVKGDNVSREILSIFSGSYSVVLPNEVAVPVYFKVLVGVELPPICRILKGPVFT